ncbi:hypothetical protein ACQR1W_10765 [Bradyrhizobium sp. HKCCYLS1011]|uniref:hypothetical protein n=1 Tax=Bradyrhizobium sp. HKCCYLS1011 TaxID=3420733 RepID=UPI003EBD024E
MLSRTWVFPAIAFALSLAGLPQAVRAHGGVGQDPWNPAHLSNLPSDIRGHVKKWEAACGAPIAAAQQFALYLTIPGTQFVALHFDDFQCRNKIAVCNASGCLHEVYVANHGRYRKVLTVRARDVRLISERNAAFVEIQDGSREGRTLLRWSGSRFLNWAGTRN